MKSIFITAEHAHYILTEKGHYLSVMRDNTKLVMTNKLPANTILSPQGIYFLMKTTPPKTSKLNKATVFDAPKTLPELVSLKHNIKPPEVTRKEVVLTVNDLCEQMYQFLDSVGFTKKVKKNA